MITEQPRTFDSILPGVLPLVPEVLIGADFRSRVQAVASCLPAILSSSTFGFECPLATDRPEADFLVSVSGTRGATLLSETALHAMQSDSNPVWSSVAELAELWAKKGRIDNIWLEFDLVGETPFVPNLFFQPVYEAGNHSELQDILSHAGPLLLGQPLSEELEKTMRRCVDALPERAHFSGWSDACATLLWTTALRGSYLSRSHPLLSRANRISRQSRGCARDLYRSSAAD